jgi:hypothetical protein
MRSFIVSLGLALAGCGSISSTPDGAAPSDGAAGGDGCVAESDEAFCARLGRTCESQSARDNCGAPRTADCGTCTGDQGCSRGVCKAPACRGGTYQVSSAAMFSRVDLEDGVNAATWDGRTIVFHQSPAEIGCESFRIIIADETSVPGTYSFLDATAVLGSLGLFTGQAAFSITEDGLTLIAETADRKHWVETSRSARDLIDFGAPVETEYVAVNATVATGSSLLIQPVITSDELEFFYYVFGGEAEGIYRSARSSTSEPFPAGTILPSPGNDWAAATGISSDELARRMLQRRRCLRDTTMT